MKIAKWPLMLAVLGALLLLIGGPGYRLGLWGLGFGLLGVMRYALILGSVAALLALVLLFVPRIRRGHVAPLVLALIVGALTAAVPWQVRQLAQSVPAIHDISTDTSNPPPFVAIAPLRADAPNPVDYPGPEVAEQQHRAYPGLAPFQSALPVPELFERALAVAREMGWEIVDADPAAGRIEAVATTFWYGFKDDVVIRIRATPEGSRLDIRSKSRVGRSDLGANAKRIREFLDRLRRRLGQS
ncbi:MAG: hypothetical protein Kow0020_02630 [Wenzhouxiangellaceae bacterium]